MARHALFWLLDLEQHYLSPCGSDDVAAGGVSGPYVQRIGNPSGHKIKDIAATLC